MALIHCYECGKQISDKAKACPDCGCPVDIITSSTCESNSAMYRYKAIDDYNYKELDKTYSEYGIRQLFNIAVKYHYDITDGALEAAFIYKYITEKYPHNIEASKSREMLEKLADEKPSLFLALPRHTVKETATSTNIDAEKRGYLDGEKYDWSWPAFFFSGLWALYNKLWSKFIIAVVVSVATPIIFKIFYSVFMIMLADKIDSYNLFMVISVLFYGVFMLGPPIMLAVWFGNNGNKWVMNCKSINTVASLNGNVAESKVGNTAIISEHYPFIRNLLACVVVIIILATSFKYIVYDVFKTSPSNMFDIAYGYVRYNIIDGISLSSGERTAVNNLTKRILFKINSSEVNEFSANTTMSDIVSRYQINKYIRYRNNISDYDLYVSGVNFTNKSTGDKIRINDDSVDITRTNGLTYNLHFNGRILKMNKGLIVNPKLVSVECTQDLTNENDKVRHMIYTRIIDMFDGLEFNHKEHWGYFRTNYHNKPDDYEASVSYDDGEINNISPTIRWSIKLRLT